MNITIKGLKLIRSRSQETHCFSATIYVDDKVLCAVDNDGHGGCDMYTAAKKSPDDWRIQLAAVETELAKEKIEKYDLNNCLEFVVSDLINVSAIETDVKKLMKRRIAYTMKSKSGIFQLPAKYKPTPAALVQVKNSPWWTDDCTLMTDMSLSEAVEVYRNN